MKRAVLKEAFLDSLPVMMGYLSMGIAFGILYSANTGLSPFWAFLMGVTIVSGSLQFAAVDMLSSSMPLLQVGLLTLFINIRYSMYGLSLIRKFREIALRRRWYLIFMLTDENYALIVKRLPKCGYGDSDGFMLALSVMNHLYWIIGCLTGAVFGSLVKFNTQGIEFSMTALFLVILTDQCREKENRIPAFIGLLFTALSRYFFGADQMLIPAMVFMIAGFLILRKHLEKPDRKEALP